MYKLTDEEIQQAVFEQAVKDKVCEPDDKWRIEVMPGERAIADAATKKTRNETIKEVKAWLEACGLKVDPLELTCAGDTSYADIIVFLKGGIAGAPQSIDDPNRFFPKEIE